MAMQNVISVGGSWLIKQTYSLLAQSAYFYYAKINAEVPKYIISNFKIHFIKIYYEQVNSIHRILLLLF